MDYIHLGLIDPKAIQKVVIDDMLQEINRSGYFEKPYLPTNEDELALMLDPVHPWYNSSRSPPSNLSSSEPLSLSQLASNLWDAETPEDKYTASEGMRSGLLAHGFDPDWVNLVVKKRRRPEFKSNINCQKAPGPNTASRCRTISGKADVVFIPPLQASPTATRAHSPNSGGFHECSTRRWSVTSRSEIIVADITMSA
jgi:hypothetical protein